VAGDDDEPTAARLARTQPFADWPKDDAAVADERATLVAFLDYQRAVLGRKAHGLSDGQARRAACPPSDLSIIGLIRHMADVERNWSQRRFAGENRQPLYYGDAHPDGDPDGDFHPPADATLAEALSTFWAEVAASDRIYSAASLDDVARDAEPAYTLRWILVHLIEEYSRHCGHADLVRQALDGATGD
jgi:uncharacterized damage-inducible protein DinB